MGQEGREPRQLQSLFAGLKSANVTWDDKTLNEWIKDPQHLVPGNEMTFDGIKDDHQRADLLAFLKQASQPGASVAQGRQMGGMSGMMGGGRVPNLKHLDPENRVQAITYCKDTYTITTANGQTRGFWERNLRLKTDASGDGPEKNAPALVGAGMAGDRADVIFAALATGHRLPPMSAFGTKRTVERC